MEVKQEVGAVRDEQAPLPVHAPRIQVLELVEQGVQVHHRAIAQQVHRVGVHYAAGQQVEGVLLVPHHHRVARIGATIEARNNVVAEGARKDDDDDKKRKKEKGKRSGGGAKKKSKEKDGGGEGAGTGDMAGR